MQKKELEKRATCARFRFQIWGHRSHCPEAVKRRRRASSAHVLAENYVHGRSADFAVAGGMR